MEDIQPAAERLCKGERVVFSTKADPECDAWAARGMAELDWAAFSGRTRHLGAAGIDVKVEIRWMWLSRLSSIKFSAVAAICALRAARPTPTERAIVDGAF